MGAVAVVQDVAHAAGVCQGVHAAGAHAGALQVGQDEGVGGCAADAGAAACLGGGLGCVGGVGWWPETLGTFLLMRRARLRAALRLNAAVEVAVAVV